MPPYGHFPGARSVGCWQFTVDFPSKNCLLEGCCLKQNHACFLAACVHQRIDEDDSRAWPPSLDLRQLRRPSHLVSQPKPHLPLLTSSPLPNPALLTSSWVMLPKALTPKLSAYKSLPQSLFPRAPNLRLLVAAWLCMGFWIPSRGQGECWKHLACWNPEIGRTCALCEQ